MTTTELPAGRELDALVTEKVMGWERIPTSADTPELEAYPQFCEDGTFRGAPPNYSTDIAAAWLVVEAMVHRDRRCQSRVSVTYDWFKQEWTCAFFGEGNPLVGGSGGHRAPTVMLAICHAALAAVSPPPSR